MMHRHLVPTRALRGLVGAALAAFLALGLAWDARADDPPTPEAPRADEPAAPEAGPETFIVTHGEAHGPLRVEVRKVLGGGAEGVAGEPGDDEGAAGREREVRIEIVGPDGRRIERHLPRGPGGAAGTSREFRRRVLRLLRSRGADDDEGADDDARDTEDDDGEDGPRAFDVLPDGLALERGEDGPVVVWRGRDGETHRLRGRRGRIVLEDGTEIHTQIEAPDLLDRPEGPQAGRGVGAGRGLEERVARLERENRQLRAHLIRLQQQVARAFGGRGARPMGPGGPMGMGPGGPMGMGPGGPMGMGPGGPMGMGPGGPMGMGPGGPAGHGPQHAEAPHDGMAQRLERIEHLLERLVSQKGPPSAAGSIPAIRLRPAPGAPRMDWMPPWTRLDAHPPTEGPSPSHPEPGDLARRREEMQKRLVELRERLQELQRLDKMLDAQEKAGER